MITRRDKTLTKRLMRWFEGIKRALRFVVSRQWFPWLLWMIVIVPSIRFLFIQWYTPTRTLGDAFVIQAIAVIFATFVAWFIWERSRAIRAKEEEEAAYKGREFLFLQAGGLIHEIWRQIFKKLIGDFPPFGKAFDADTRAKPPTMRNRLLTYPPDEIFRRGKLLHDEAARLWERASELRVLAYSLAVQLRLQKFLKDWDQFVIEWGQLLRELEHPWTNEPQEGVLRINAFAQNVFELFRDLSTKLESKNYR